MVSADVSGAGSVEAAAAEVLAEHDDPRCRATCGRDGRWTAPTTHAEHQAAQLAAAQLLAAPVPAADADEVEVVADALVATPTRGLVEGGAVVVDADAVARAVLDVLASIRARQVADAEQRGRRAGIVAAWAALANDADAGEATS